MAGIIRSDPRAREQSQGHRPQACGPTNAAGNPSPLDYLFNLRDAGRRVIDEAQDFAEDPQGYLKDLANKAWENFRRNWTQMRDPRTWLNLWDTVSSIQNRQDFRKNWGWALSAGIGMLPVIGTAYDIACLAFERDLITGEKLSDAEKLLIMAGLIGGLIGASFLDEAFDLSSELLKNVSRVDDLADAAKGGKAIGHLDEVADAAKGLGHLDEAMDAAKNLDNVDDALDIAKNLDNLDNALDATKNLDELEDANLLNRLDEVTAPSAGKGAMKQGGELREALTRNNKQGALSKRLEQQRVNQRLQEVAGNNTKPVKQGNELRESLTNVRSGATLKSVF